MKDWLFILLLGALGVFAFRAFRPAATQPATIPAETVLAPISAATPLPSEALPTRPASPFPHTGGSAFLTRYTSAWSKRGVYGFEPGTRVNVVMADDAKAVAQISDGVHQANVSYVDLTTDPAMAAAARRQDEQAQQQLAADQEAKRQAYRKYQMATAIASASDLEHGTHAAPAGATSPSHVNMPVSAPPSSLSTGGLSTGSLAPPPSGRRVSIDGEIVSVDTATGTLIVSASGRNVIGAESVDGIVAVKGAPAADRVGDGDHVHITARESGFYDYTSVMNAGKRVRAYAYMSGHLTTPTGRNIY